jgi:hypothetical protein
VQTTGQSGVAWHDAGDAPEPEKNIRKNNG